jgi:ATP-dependent DNA ligase
LDRPRLGVHGRRHRIDDRIVRIVGENADDYIRKKPLREREKILKGLLPRNPLLHYSKHIAEFGTREFAKAQRAHEEGVIAIC